MFREQPGPHLREDVWCGPQTPLQDESIEAGIVQWHLLRGDVEENGPFLHDPNHLEETWGNPKLRPSVHQDWLDPSEMSSS